MCKDPALTDPSSMQFTACVGAYVSTSLYLISSACNLQLAVFFISYNFPWDFDSSAWYVM